MNSSRIEISTAIQMDSFLGELRVDPDGEMDGLFPGTG